MRNEHPGAGTLLSTVDPYDVTTGRIEPYPGPIPANFDLHLLAVTARHKSGTGSLTAALLIGMPAAAQGWGITDTGAAAPSALSIPVAYWTSLVTQSVSFGVLGNTNPQQRVGMRLRRGTTVQFSSTASALASFEAQIIFGLFPVGLGQDVLL
jgi:hypothetical protein